jgi:tight adherence protein C
MKWLHIAGLDDQQAQKLFILVALAGNGLGMLLTIQSGGIRTEQRLTKVEDTSYEQKFEVSVEGGESGSLYIQIPEKESEVSEQEERTSEDEEITWQQELRDAVVYYNEEKNDPDYYYLPKQWEGKNLEWVYPTDHTGTLIAALGIFAALVIFVRKVREEEEARAKRYEELLLDYPGLIMKFTLLVQAGMTVRKTFQKIALDYQRKRVRKKRAAYEEILITCYEMESGVSESEAYRRFGERCGQIKYKTFATLLIQNLQKGSRQLADMLEEESLEAWEERKRKARVQGEVASTKLLFPMILMLIVVMALIMVPAFLSFYG